MVDRVILNNNGLRVSYPGYDVKTAPDQFLIFDSNRRASRYRERFEFLTGPNTPGWRTRNFPKPFVGEPFNMFRILGDHSDRLYLNAANLTDGLIIKTINTRVEWLVSGSTWANRTVYCYLWDWEA